jgi:hypothetical protein
MTIQIDPDIELQIKGYVLAGDYRRAADIAVKNGSDAVLVAMNAAMKDGFKEAMEHMAHYATGELQRKGRGR